jgi:PASTA domain
MKKRLALASVLALSGSLGAAGLLATSTPSFAGTTICKVPNVRGQTLPRAKHVVVRAHCRVGKIGRAYSKTVKRGRVISERPKPTTVLRSGGKVSLVLSRGRKPRSAPPPATSELLLWNKLGSADEVTHSAYGPNLAFFDCRDPVTPYFGQRCQTDISGLLAYPSGVFGGAAGIAGGPYFPTAREHTMLLRVSILHPEHGAVEAWYRQASDPVPYRHNPHRIFGGPYSLTGVDEVQLFSQDRLDSGHPRLHFSVFFGDEPPPFTQPHVVAVRSLVDGAQGYPISALNGSWIHVAGVWDRSGIAGSADTVRLYVNGKVVAASRAKGWGTTPCASRRPAGQWRCFTDIAGCNDTCANAFAVDNLKLWSYAKTDYSDRFKEGP